VALPFATCTVVIPCYNGQAELKAAVDSVLAQTYQDFHLVIVDDASRDGTLALAHQLAEGHPNITVLGLPENRGRSGARNAGTELTRGPYVSFLDHDDTYQPDFLRVTTTALAQSPDLDAVKVLPNLAIDIDPVRYNAVAGALVTTLLIRREAFHAIGGFPESKVFQQYPIGGEDWAFQVLFSYYFDVGVVHRRLYDYSHRPGNTLDKFLARTRVVNGQIVYTDAVDDDKAVVAEIDRLTKLLRKRVRHYAVAQGASPFLRLGQDADARELVRLHEEREAKRKSG
jgi:glycosyltransferase involved in cell wall biosynthesis